MNNNNSTQAPTVSETKQPYENNPFFVATNGLDLLFKKAQPIGIVLAILAALSAISAVPSYLGPDTDQASTEGATGTAGMDKFVEFITNIPPEVWILIGGFALLVLAIIIAINTVIKGIIDVTAARLAKGKTTTISEAFREVFSNFWGYLWVLVITNVKIFLWTLLFIIPGFIMAIRYSLSGVVYFDKKLSGNQSVVESARITKGAWITTFASQILLNILTLGFISYLLSPGTNAVLYRQLSPLTGEKPKPHILSRLALIIPIVIGSIVFFTLLLLLLVVVNQQPTT